MSFNIKSDQIEHVQVAPMGILVMRGTEEIGKKVDEHLRKLYASFEGTQKNVDSFLLSVKCPRFQSGDGKAVLDQSVRGLDVYIISDVGNYNCTYNMFGQEVPMSPDDHFADLKTCDSGNWRQSASCKCDHADLIRRPSTSEGSQRVFGLCCRIAGAAEYGRV